MLFSEFSKYGEIVDSIVMKNPETGNSRGFGFVTYKENSAAENAVNSGSHRIDGKIVLTLEYIYKVSLLNVSTH
jgi:hypothetical protein